MRAPGRVAAILVAIVNSVIGGYLLLSANGVFMGMLERGTVWEGSTPLPSYPVAHMVVYLAITLALQSLSAWLLMPRRSRREIAGFWGRYTARLALCFGGSVVAAVVMLIVVTSLLDSGII